MLSSPEFKPGRWNERRDPNFGRCGFHLNFFPAQDPEDSPLIVLKGGLGDDGSHSLGEITEAMIDIGSGEVSIATVGTVRPYDLRKAFKAAFVAEDTSYSRYLRLKAFNKGAEETERTLRPRAVLYGGQSQGGVTAIDVALDRRDKQRESRKSGLPYGVVTINAPGVYDAMDYEGIDLVSGLFRLVKHVSEGVLSLERKQLCQLVEKNLRNPLLLLEWGYMIGELRYLKSVGLAEPIQDLRRSHVPVGHIFHDQDIIEGAAKALKDSRALVLSGTHTTFMKEPEPIARALVSAAKDLVEAPKKQFEMKKYTPFAVDLGRLALAA